MGRGFAYLGLLLVLTGALPALATVHNVTVRNFQFSPATLTVAQGDTVVWTNVQGTHNVHHTGNPTLFHIEVGSGWTFSFAFDVEAGTYDYVCQPHAPDMAGSVTVVPLAAPEPVAGIAREVRLSQNYPNPFNGRTEIDFEVPMETNARLTILNVLGQQIAEPFAGRVAAGKHHVVVDAGALSTGVYFYRLEAGHATLIRTMHFIK